jgi:hypothetical protein
MSNVVGTPPLMGVIISADFHQMTAMDEVVDFKTLTVARSVVFTIPNKALMMFQCEDSRVTAYCETSKYEVYSFNL